MIVWYAIVQLPDCLVRNCLGTRVPGTQLPLYTIVWYAEVHDCLVRSCAGTRLSGMQLSKYTSVWYTIAQVHDSLVRSCAGMLLSGTQLSRYAIVRYAIYKIRDCLVRNCSGTRLSGMQLSRRQMPTKQLSSNRLHIYKRCNDLLMPFRKIISIFQAGVEKWLNLFHFFLFFMLNS